MRKLLLLSALVLGLAFTLNAQNNTTRDPRKTSNPRETHQVNTNTHANSQRPSIAPKQNSSSQSSYGSSTSNNMNSKSSSTRRDGNKQQRDAVNNGKPKYGNPR